MPASTTRAGVPSGLPAVGTVAWGTHLCHFFDSGDDLREALVPYLRAGLDNGEQCLWITSEPLGPAAARAALAEVVPDLADRERRGQIEILDYADWYAGVDGMDGDAVLRTWLDRERDALDRGLTGLRITGNTSWLERQDWDTFTDYEAAVHDAFRDRNILALCSYSLDRCTIEDVLDVLHNHEFALLRRDGVWEPVSSATQLVGAVQASTTVVASALTVHRRLERDASKRLACLQRVTSALSQVRTLDQLDPVVERHVCPALGAAHALVVAADETVSRVGTADDRLADAGESMWLRSEQEIARRYPELPTTASAVASVPLRIAGGTIGKIVIGFPAPQRFEATQRALIEDIAHQIAMTIDRARLFEEAERQRVRVERASKAKDEFLAMLGHELRNPLAAIRSASELLRLSPSDGTVHRIQAVLERQTAHMAKLLDGLLDVSRIVRGKYSLDKQPVDLRAIVAESVQDRLAQPDSARAELRVELGDDELRVLGDRVRLAQIFDNLLSNAFKFTHPPGTIDVTARADADEGCAVLAIRDTGIGIDPDLLPHIFEPFQQGAQELARTAGGLGLGLAVVKGLVDLHGGRVRARSEGVGKGTEVELRLPLLDGHGSRARELPRQPTARPAAYRVLVVEDNEDSADLLREVLETVGHQSEVANDGDSALQVARRFAPDVVLCDIGLPGSMDGYDVARAFRDDDDLSDAFMVALTGYGRPEDIARARAAGFDAHLTKPIDLEAVQALLAERAP